MYPTRVYSASNYTQMLSFVFVFSCFMGICYGANIRYGKEACKGADLCVDNASNVEGFDKAFSLNSGSGKKYGASSVQEDANLDDTLYIHVGGSFGLDQAPTGVDYKLVQSNNDIEKRLGTAACCYGEFGQVSKRDDTLSQDIVSKSNDENTESNKRAANTPKLPQSYTFTYGPAPAEWYGFLEKAAVGTTAINNVAQALDKVISGIALAFNKKGICDNQNLYDATNGTGLKVCFLNDGQVCDTTAQYETLYDGVKEVINYFANKDCRRCCATLTHGGSWAGIIKMVDAARSYQDEKVNYKDTIDPCKINCDSHTKHWCKTNEHWDNPCPNKHDEL